MGNRAFQVTRIVKGSGQMSAISANDQVSVMVYGCQDDLEARIQGAAMLGVPPASVTVQEYETTGLSVDEAIAQAEAIDASTESGKMMADWLRGGMR